MSKLLLKVELDGNTTFLPIEDIAQVAHVDGAVVTVVDADTMQVAENVETVRQGEDLVVVVQGENVAVVDGFYTEGSDLTFVSSEGSIGSHDPVWVLSTSGEEAQAGFLGGSGGMVIAGLGGLAVLAAVGGSDSSSDAGYDAGYADGYDAGSSNAPSDADVLITISLDTDSQSSTYGQWLSSSDGGMAIDADLSYEIRVVLPDVAVIDQMYTDGDLQTSGDLGGDGLMSQAWNLGADDKIVWMFPDTLESSSYSYFSHSAYNWGSGMDARAGGMITDYENYDTGYEWVSLYFTVKSSNNVTDHSFLVEFRPTATASYSKSSVRFTINAFTSDSSAVPNSFSALGNFNTEHRFYAA